VEVRQVDVVRSQAAKRTFDSGTNVHWLARHDWAARPRWPASRHR
jgi:hypothetical protein